MELETPIYAPHAIWRTNQGLNVVDLRDDMLMHRRVELAGEVTSESVAVLTRSLLYLQQEDPEAPITMFINSPGGEVQSGLALYDVMQSISCDIHTVCLGLAASMAAIIFVAGEKRSMLPHSRVMIHDPLIAGGGIAGPALSVKSRADQLMRTRDITAELIAKHTGMSLERVLELTATDTYFEAKEAVEAHLADEVLDDLANGLAR